MLLAILNGLLAVLSVLNTLCSVSKSGRYFHGSCAMLFTILFVIYVLEALGGVR